MIVLVVLGACAVGLLVGLARQPRPAALCDQVDKDDLAVNFGLGREPMTRTRWWTPSVRKLCRKGATAAI